MSSRDDPSTRASRERILDELLVINAQSGSPEAFRRLVERWQERLWRHAFALTGREDAAWDIVQETWVVVAREFGKLRDANAFRRWTFTIATRAATDRLRRRGLEPEPLEDEIDPVLDTTEEDERRQAVLGLRAALAQLPRDERTLLSLRYFEEFELWELARIFGVPEGTLKSRLHHARQHLKEILERMER